MTPERSHESDAIELRFSTYHLGQAASEIARLLTAISMSQPIEYETAAPTLAHAYNHLNWFWNGRNRSDPMSVEFSSAEELQALSAFPTDLQVQMGPGFGKVTD